MIYLMIILATMLISIRLAVVVSLKTGKISLLYAFLAPTVCLLYVLIALGIIDVVLRLFVPESFWNYDKKLFRVSKKEVNLYEKLGIRKWKNKVPELGQTAGFSKRNLKSTDVDYLQKFLKETCIGEAMHAGGAILGFTCLIIFPLKSWFFILPIVIVNFVLNVIPCVIQRYTRSKLAVIYKFKTRHAIAEAGIELKREI